MFHKVPAANQHRGSVALISLLVISAFTLIFAVAMSESSVWTAYKQQNNEANHFMDYTAEACLEEALLRLEEDPTFATTTITFEEGVDCTVTASGSSLITLSIEATYFDHTEHFEAELSVTTSGQANNATLLRWQEI